MFVPHWLMHIQRTSLGDFLVSSSKFFWTSSRIFAWKCLNYTNILHKRKFSVFGLWTLLSGYVGIYLILNLGCDLTCDPHYQVAQEKTTTTEQKASHQRKGRKCLQYALDTFWCTFENVSGKKNCVKCSKFLWDKNYLKLCVSFIHYLKPLKAKIFEHLNET